MKYAYFNNKSFTNSVEICLILITKFAKLLVKYAHFINKSFTNSIIFAKLIQFWRNILQIWQDMYDFGEISLTCLTKYAIFFGIAKIMTDN